MFCFFLVGDCQHIQALKLNGATQPLGKFSPILKCRRFFLIFGEWLHQVCVRRYDSVPPPQPENSSETTSVFSSCTHTVPLPLLHPEKEKELLDTPNEFTSTLPRVKPERKTEKERGERRGGGSEMCFKDGRAPTHCTVPFSCLRTQRGRTGSCVEIKDGCKAPHHQTQLHSTPKSFKTSEQLTSSARSHSLLVE